MLMLICKIDNYSLKKEGKNRKKLKDKTKYYWRKSRETNRFTKKIKEKDKKEREKKSWTRFWCKDCYKKKIKKRENKERKRREKDRDFNK